MLPENLMKLIRRGEGLTVEFKKSTTDITKDVYDTVCSFSNRDGGHIFFGVKDNGTILGVDKDCVEQMKKNFVTTINNESKMYPPLYLTPEEYEIDGRIVLYVYVPVGKTVYRNAGRILDRNNESDIDITDNADMVFNLYARKQSTYYVNRVYPHWSVSDLRADLIDKAREMAITRKQLFDKQRHPWADMDNEELLRTSGLILTDEEGRTGITLAAVLLFGTDNMIASACAHHKTDCIYRVYNVDRYDDREVILTNLLESYEQMFAFGQKHLNDLFVLDGIQSVSARDKILREIISNSLAHRDYSSGYVAKLLIERDRITVENGNRAHGIGALDIRSFEPFAKNPTISKVFREIGYADELGSGMRNSYKYTMMYSGAEPEFIEGDVFKIIIPLSFGSMTKVGPGSILPVASGQVGKSSGEVGGEVSGEVGGEVGGEVIRVNLDVQKLNALLEYCKEARSRTEMQSFCGIKSQDYFRRNILLPLLESGRLKRTIPDKPNSSKQKYIRA